MQADAENVVYLSAGTHPGGEGVRVAGGAGEDTIGVSGNVLAFGRSSGMHFLDAADSGLAVGGAGGAAVPGGLGSVTLLGGEALSAAPIAAVPSSGPPDEFGLAAALPEVIGAIPPGGNAALSPELPGKQAPSIAATSTLQLPDGTTVMMLDISKLAGSPLL